MKALIAQRGSHKPQFADVAGAELTDGQVRVAVAAAGFTYFDAFVSAHGAELGLPDEVGLGFDFSGTVTEVGAEVDGIAVGDRVAGLHDDITAPARAHAEEVVVAATAVAVVPVGLELDVAAAVTLSALTARQSLDLLGPDRGSLLVTGAAGAIGGWLIELAQREGWSVTSLVRPGTEGQVASGSVITSLSGTYDAVLDAAALHAPALAVVRDGGRYVGFKPGQPQPSERGIAISTVQVVPDGDALADLLPLAADGAVTTRIAGRSSLSDAGDAYDAAGAGTGSRGRWLLIP
ncbi:alcohol dehydrogenase catalytic domain-containing protein [Nocardioides sp. WS12]|uniref:alcohol dehydrogenase catalytic domain-containing protein n=1 Tax=Nocardioides sp. WS12 TaxID=2486272 RepID=UPI0015FA77BB|nr:alcohol dehydrogenase catalytic domain-containing protein [Nocardioides sp. WS12]